MNIHKKQSEHLESIINLAYALNPNLDTIQEGALIDRMPYKIELVSKGNILALQGVTRWGLNIVEATIEDTGYLTPQDIGGLIEAFKLKAKERHLQALEKEKEEARVQTIIDKPPKPRGGYKGRKPKEAKPKVEKPKVIKVDKPKPVKVAKPRGRPKKIKEEVMEVKEEIKPAIRHNQDKVRYDLIPPEFIREIAEVFTFGAKKYSPNNWKRFTPEQQEEIKASLLRHIYAYLEGQELDKESGLHHLAHAGCNLAFLAYFRNRG